MLHGYIPISAGWTRVVTYCIGPLLIHMSACSPAVFSYSLTPWSAISWDLDSIQEAFWFAINFKVCYNQCKSFISSLVIHDFFGFFGFSNNVWESKVHNNTRIISTPNGFFYFYLIHLYHNLMGHK